MSSNPRRVTAMAHVASVSHSIAFYAHLGFTVRNTFAPHGALEPAWAFLESGDATLMLAAASGPIDREAQAVLFYLYYDDVAATHARLAALGLAVGPITHPFYCPRGEFRLLDPDGYCLMLTHV